MKQADLQTILDKVEFLFERYSMTRRASTQPYMLKVAQEQIPDYSYGPDNELVRETLIEHVGSLPMLAIELFPNISDPEVDLARALEMLAIHDIGELVTGDEMTFTKKPDGAALEHQAALKLLDPMYHDLYNEVEGKTTKSAKFAKSIDKINPDIIDYLMPPDITIWRYRHFMGTNADQIIDLIVKHKRPYMLWNPFMTGFHIFLMDRLADKLKTENN